MRKTIISLAALSTALHAAALDAQTISSRWSGNSRRIDVNTYMPPICDPATSGAFATWNNAGSQFRYPFSSANNLTTDSAIRSNSYANSIIEDGSTGSSTVPMKTNQIMTADGATLLDAYIVVSSDYLWFNYDDQGGLFHCGSGAPPAGKVDYQNALAHELGHALGFIDAYSSSSASCIMYYSLAKGVSRRSLCAAERTAVQNKYR